MAKEKKPVDLYKRAKPVKGRLKVLKVLPYKGHMIYLRMIDDDIFEYLLIFNNEIYSSYIVITPRKGKKKLAGWEINQSAALILQGAVTTIDTLRGEAKLDEKMKQTVKIFEEGREAFERMEAGVAKDKKKLLN